MKKFLSLCLLCCSVWMWLQGMVVFGGCSDYSSVNADACASAGCYRNPTWWCEESSTSSGAVVCDTDKMLGVGCKMDVYDMLGIKQWGEDKEARTSVLTFVQDIVLAATMFIGTVVTLAFILSGLLFVFSAADSSLKQKAKKGMINAAIGMILVAGSYAIIRLIQFIARG